ncbi:MAG: erythromycin esterase family protein [Myxococcales bacterium]|nr:erythromycin esterase family protein [Myxococcales bacterium]
MAFESRALSLPSHSRRSCGCRSLVRACPPRPRRQGAPRRPPHLQAHWRPRPRSHRSPPLTLGRRSRSGRRRHPPSPRGPHVDAARGWSPALRASILTAFERFPKQKKFSPLGPETRAQDRAAFAALRKALAASGNADPQGALVLRTLDAVDALYRWHEAVGSDRSQTIPGDEHVALNSVRDQAMAENLLWLLDRHASSRVVVWLAFASVLPARPRITTRRSAAGRHRLVGPSRSDAQDPGSAREGSRTLMPCGGGT